MADSGGRHEESHARLVLAEAAIARIGELEARGSSHGELLGRLRSEQVHRTEHLEDRGEAEPADAAEQERVEHREIVQAVVDAEREALLRLRDRGAITDEAFRRLERDLDLAALRMDV
jgi:CPA1 family monovalent cation:H+ antiporter